MPSLWNLITCARLGGPWTKSWFASVRSTSTDVITRCADHLDPCRLPAPVPIPVPRPRHFGRALIPALALAVLPFANAHAAYRSVVQSGVDGQLVDVQVLVDGRTAPLYLSPDGSDRNYFQAFRGRKYALSLTNNTGRRIGVLIAVDGLNVVNGERSRLASSEPMYVLDPWEHATIRGWRSSLQEVRQFVFVDEERSYATRTGQASGDLGWIRVQAFNEQPRWYDYGQRLRDDDRLNEERPYGALDKKERARAPEASRDQAGSPAPQVEGGDDGLKRQEPSKPNTAYQVPPPAEAAPGTGWGDRRHDPVQQVWFQPERCATDRIVLRYEYAAGLRALGIDPRRTRDRLWEREHGELGFAQPPGW